MPNKNKVRPNTFGLSSLLIAATVSFITLTLSGCGGSGGSSTSVPDPVVPTPPSPPPTSPPAPEQQTAEPIRIEAESYAEESGTQLEGAGIGFFDPDDWLKYEGVDFGRGGHNSIAFHLAVDAGYAGGTIRVRLDSLTGALLAEHTVESTNGWSNYELQITTLEQEVDGVHDIYIEGAGGSGGIANIDYFVFDEVEAELAFIRISPANALVDLNASEQFTLAGVDQFGNEFDVTSLENLTWNVSQGEIDSDGFFTASGNITESAIFVNASIANSDIESTALIHMTGDLSANPNVLKAVNVGGLEYIATTGIRYVADEGFTSGALIETQATINGTPDGTLYQSQRAGSLSYRQSMENGTYAVTVMMAEINNRNSNFNINIEGQQRFGDVNIVASRDGKRNSNYDLTIDSVEVTDGSLDIDFSNDASVAGLIVRSQPTESTWELVWQDEFDVDGAVDASKWTHENWAPGNVNNELQRYTSRTENSRVEDGKLIIEARRDFYMDDEYSSARIHSRGKGDLLYGRVEVRAKLPDGRGTWPAIWMMPSDFFTYATTCTAATGWIAGCDAWPNSGEIDIMEHVGFDTGHIWATVHNKAYYWVNSEQRKGALWDSSVTDEFHVYAMEWTPTRIDIFVNDAVMFSYANEGQGWQSWPYDQPFHLILNVAVGGNWGGAQGVDPNIWPKRMEIDYVRMYQRTE